MPVLTRSKTRKIILLLFVLAATIAIVAPSQAPAIPCNESWGPFPPCLLGCGIPQPWWDYDCDMTNGLVCFRWRCATECNSSAPYDDNWDCQPIGLNCISSAPCGSNKYCNGEGC